MEPIEDEKVPEEPAGEDSTKTPEKNKPGKTKAVAKGKAKSAPVKKTPKAAEKKTEKKPDKKTPKAAEKETEKKPEKNNSSAAEKERQGTRNQRRRHDVCKFSSTRFQVYKDGGTVQLLFQQQLCTPKPVAHKFSSTRFEVQNGSTVPEAWVYTYELTSMYT